MYFLAVQVFLLTRFIVLSILTDIPGATMASGTGTVCHSSEGKYIVNWTSSSIASGLDHGSGIELCPTF